MFLRSRSRSFSTSTWADRVHQSSQVVKAPGAEPGVFVVCRACSVANGCKCCLNLMEVKGSEAQGRHREVGSEGSVKQRYGPMYKNRIRGLRRRTSRPRTTKSISIKDAGGKSGGRVSKAADTHASEEGPNRKREPSNVWTHGWHGSSPSASAELGRFRRR